MAVLVVSLLAGITFYLLRRSRRTVLPWSRDDDVTTTTMIGGDRRSRVQHEDIVAKTYDGLWNSTFL